MNGLALCEEEGVLLSTRLPSFANVNKTSGGETVLFQPLQSGSAWSGIVFYGELELLSLRVDQTTGSIQSLETKYSCLPV